MDLILIEDSFDFRTLFYNYGPICILRSSGVAGEITFRHKSLLYLLIFQQLHAEQSRPKPQAKTTSVVKIR